LETGATAGTSEPYEFSEWRMRRVGINYHIEVAAEDVALDNERY
jgi:hypothetical protein